MEIEKLTEADLMDYFEPTNKFCRRCNTQVASDPYGELFCIICNFWVIDVPQALGNIGDEKDNQE